MSFTKHKVTILQGALGDMAVDQLGWLSQKEQDEFWKNHKEHVKELKERGEYLKPLELEVTMEDDPLYDSPVQPKGNPTQSYRMTFLNFTDECDTGGESAAASYVMGIDPYKNKD
jgi:hypothetical protein